MNFIAKHTNKALVFSGNPQREEKWDYPMEAIREIVLNMIVHRDYKSSYDSVIKIYNNKIEFTNPGGLPEGLTVESLKEGNFVSTPRNKLIAAIFKEAGLIEKYGSGIKRVIEAFKKSSMPEPIFESTDNFFKVTIFNSQSHIAPEVAPEVAPEIAPEIATKILEIIAQNPYVTINEISNIIGKSLRSTKSYISVLKKKGILIREGSTKKGKWIVNKNMEIK
ncbi:MAG: winged helix-turn-helix transcriptional regulator [Deferribacterales bacterium]|nr:winged helix-turn-helix transcriptional regulator [Deferribacterales bacterium]